VKLYNTRTKPVNTVFGGICGGQNAPDSGYQGIPEKEYPRWFCRVMEELRPKLTEDGNVLVVLGSQIKDGEECDYVHRTRDAVRSMGRK